MASSSLSTTDEEGPDRSSERWHESSLASPTEESGTLSRNGDAVVDSGIKGKGKASQSDSLHKDGRVHPSKGLGMAMQSTLENEGEGAWDHDDDDEKRVFEFEVEDEVTEEATATHERKPHRESLMGMLGKDEKAELNKDSERWRARPEVDVFRVSQGHVFHMRPLNEILCRTKRHFRDLRPQAYRTSRKQDLCKARTDPPLLFHLSAKRLPFSDLFLCLLLLPIHI